MSDAPSWLTEETISTGVKAASNPAVQKAVKTAASNPHVQTAAKAA